MQLALEKLLSHWYVTKFSFISFLRAFETEILLSVFLHALLMLQVWLKLFLDEIYGGILFLFVPFYYG